MKPEQLIEAEFLRDEGWPDDEIAAHLGVDLTEVATPESKRCKTPGCDNAANARYTRGIFTGLCVVCIEVRREQASAQGKRVSATHRRGLTHRDRILARRPAQVDEPEELVVAKPPPVLQLDVKLVDVVEEFRDDEGHLEELLAQEMPQFARASCVPVKGGSTFSRAGLAYRIAKEIATSRHGVEWWQIPMATRESFVRLAAQFVSALEEVAAKSPVAGHAKGLD